MLFVLKAQDGKEKFFYTSIPFKSYFNRSGYYKVEIVNYDASHLDKGYLTLLVYDKEEDVIRQTNLIVKNNNPNETTLPLEKIIKILLKNSGDEEVNVLEVNLEDLVGLECQFLVEQDYSYYNVKNVYPIDEELGEYVPKKSHSEILIERSPNGIFNSENKFSKEFIF